MGNDIFLMLFLFVMKCNKLADYWQQQNTRAAILNSDISFCLFFNMNYLKNLNLYKKKNGIITF